MGSVIELWKVSRSTRSTNEVKNLSDFPWNCFIKKCCLRESRIASLLDWHLKILTENSCRNSWCLYTLTTNYFPQGWRTVQFLRIFFYSKLSLEVGDLSPFSQCYERTSLCHFFISLKGIKGGTVNALFHLLLRVINKRLGEIEGSSISYRSRQLIISVTCFLSFSEFWFSFLIISVSHHHFLFPAF